MYLHLSLWKNVTSVRRKGCLQTFLKRWFYCSIAGNIFDKRLHLKFWSCLLNGGWEKRISVFKNSQCILNEECMKLLTNLALVLLIFFNEIIVRRKKANSSGLSYVKFNEKYFLYKLFLPKNTMVHIWWGNKIKCRRVIYFTRSRATWWVF